MIRGMRSNVEIVYKLRAVSGEDIDGGQGSDIRPIHLIQFARIAQERATKSETHATEVEEGGSGRGCHGVGAALGALYV